MSASSNLGSQGSGFGKAASEPTIVAAFPAAERPQWPLLAMRKQSYRKGEYLFHIGDNADRLFFINKGYIRLPEVNKVIKAGQVIGEMGVFSPGRQRTASAVCEEDLEAYTMDRNDVIEFFRRDPNLAIDLLQLSNKRFIENLKAETESKERIKSELRIAHDIQASMLPRAFPAFPGRKDFEVFATMDPANEVGGDFYDFFLVEENKLCLVIGDVSGKGVPAALFMAISKTLLKSEAMRGFSPHEVISRVNNLLCKDNPICMYVTVFMLILNTDTGEIECCNGGHNPPLLGVGKGPVSYLPAVKGMGLGVMEDLKCDSQKLTLKRGDLFFLYTDGVTEAMNPEKELFSEARLQSCIARLRAQGITDIVGAVRSEIATHAQTEPQSDDITMLALRYNGARRGSPTN
jgi:sigma-B regulation protein RsbU (phosphoserine phosphatase)